MKRVGVVGITYEAAAIFYRQLCERSQERFGPRMNPDILLHCPTFERFFVSEAQRAEVWSRIMIDSISMLSGAGCDFVVCPANSNHIVYESVSRQIDIPWISIVETVKSAALWSGGTRCGLLGTHFTVNSGIYRDERLELVVPAHDLQEALHSEITDYLAFGRVRPEAATLVEEIVGYLRDAGANAVILGCTELTLFTDRLNSLFNSTRHELRILDSTHLLVERTLAEADTMLL